MKKCPKCSRPFGKVRRCYVCAPPPGRSRNGADVACGVCGKGVYAPAALLGTRRFCSRPCAYRARTLEYERTWLATFWAKVPRLSTDVCWEWQGARFPDGYGVSSAPGVGHSKVAHRVSWFVHYGPIPEGADIRHKCDNPPCVNPAHLEPGTPGDNVADKMARDRQARGANTRPLTIHRGEDNVTAKLSEGHVREMRLLHADGATQVALAARYGIHQTQVSNIIRRKSWAHI